MDIQKKAKAHFYSNIKAGQDPWDLLIHVPDAERWADLLLGRYPEADREVVLLAVWLHDAAYYKGEKEVDHAIKSEAGAREFLEKEGYDSKKLEKVCHCVRAHRNKDIKPQTLEARLICLIDSVSHFTYGPYFAMTQDGRGQQSLEKLERDYRDLKLFPEVEKELTPLYKAWKVLIEELMKSPWYKAKDIL
jgi:hypothetical protein